MPLRSLASAQEAARKGRAVDDADASLLGHREEFRRAGVLQRVMVVNQGGVRRQRVEDAMPQVHRVDSEADVPDAAGLLQLQQRLNALAQRPLRAATVLVFEIVEMDEVEVIGAETARTFIERGADAGAGIVEGVVAVAAGLRVFAHLG